MFICVKLLRQVVGGYPKHFSQNVLQRHQTGNRHLAPSAEGLSEALVYTRVAAGLREADRGRSCPCKMNIGQVDGSQQGPIPEASWERGELWTRATVGTGNGGGGVGMGESRPREEGCSPELTWRING